MTKANFIRCRHIRYNLWLLPLIMMTLSVCQHASAQERAQNVLVRLAEIEIHEQHLDAYKTILKEEAEVSIRLEKGVIAIFPMFIKESPTQVRILEIYADEAAYQAHLKTAHFLKYKNSTSEMVKALKLLDMHALDLETARFIFKKMALEKEAETKDKS